MKTSTQRLDTIAQQLGIQQQELLHEGVVHFLESRQRALQAELNLLKATYKVDSTDQFEALYEQGAIEEADTWRDYQRFDTLSFKLDELKKILTEVTV